MVVPSTTPTSTVGVIGATGKTGLSVVDGLLSSTETKFLVTSLTRKTSVDSEANRLLAARGVKIVGYDLEDNLELLVSQLKGIDILISCITWEHLADQLLWIEAAKLAGVKRFVPSEWVGPAPRGVVDIKDKKLEILGAIQRAGLPYTLIDVGCWFQVFVPKVPSGRSDHAHSEYIDHRIVEDGNQKFALTDLADVGRYVARIVSDPSTINRRVFAYTELLSMNEIWDVMGKVTGEDPVREYVSLKEIQEIIVTCRKRLGEIPPNRPELALPPTTSSNVMDIANYNMGQYRISWCVRGDNTPEYADYLGYLNFWKLFPDFPRGKTLESFYRQVVEQDSTAKQLPKASEE
ncbi:isoflavone reductase family protein [Cladorrhinum samala]|uniref:Isoflavone reductase family protein n=1 Tax=Cladorrhinum samala TaxID=585594 RepID=A0AAV9HSD5_9PEZI|nr:isoflavone reductase family protein [Cladorrhinum samala]